jgi:hypothetical protein
MGIAFVQQALHDGHVKPLVEFAPDLSFHTNHRLIESPLCPISLIEIVALSK